MANPAETASASLPPVAVGLIGLSSAEVAERTAAGRVNRTARDHWAELLEIVSRNVVTVFNFMVAPAAVALFALGEWKGGLAVGALAVVNSVVSLLQELKAKRDLDRLAILVETRARVLRDGRVESVPAGDVVQDDVVLLTVGEAVVADGPVLAVRFLETDEALLTGESDPIRKSVGDVLLSGSFAVAGEGAYRAAKVGADAFAQKTASDARSLGGEPSPVQRLIDRVVRSLTYAAVGLVVCYFAASAVVGFADNERDSQRELAKLVAITVTSMVPQGLVLTATMAFTIGAVVMSRRGAIVQRLTAVETMASVDVICTDKTGTLTTNQFQLEHLTALGGHTTDSATQRLRQLVSASVDDRNKSVLALRAAVGSEPVTLLEALPFKSQNRYSAVRLAEPGSSSPGSSRVLALGAVEALAGYLSEPPAELTAMAAELTAMGLRVLLLAEQPPTATRPIDDTVLLEEDAADSAPAAPPSFDGTLAGVALRPVALLALSDELRPDAADVLQAFTAQGIAFKIISGDNPDTVRATVAALDIPASREPVVTGDQLAAADPAERDRLILAGSVFGRVSPNQKIEIVAALKAHGHTVAMLGDGVNDVLPIKGAHLGVAMGEGTTAAKTVSGLVLETNDFGLLPETLEEGRTIIRNLRRSAKLFLTKNVYAVFLLALGAFGVFGLARPFEPQQVTLLNWLTIGIPAFVIALSRERSRAASRADVAREVGSFCVRTGLVFAAAGVAVQLLGLWAYPLPRAEDGSDPELERERTVLAARMFAMADVYAHGLERYPTPSEAEAFLADAKPDALARVRETLPLAPDFGEVLFQRYISEGRRRPPPVVVAAEVSATVERFLREREARAAERLGVTVTERDSAADARRKVLSEETRRVHRSLLLTVLVLLGVTALLRALTDGEAATLLGDTWYRALALLAVPAYLAAMYAEPTQRFFNLVPLEGSAWLLAGAVTVPAWLLCLAADRLNWKP